MNSYRTRRATVDDLAQLAELWQAAHLPAAELEKQFTDFQVAEDEQGKLAAAIGLHIEGGHGRVHSETFADFALTDALRPALLGTVASRRAKSRPVPLVDGRIRALVEKGRRFFPAIG